MSTESVQPRDSAVTTWAPKTVGALLAVCIIWGSTYLAMRMALRTVPPFLMAGSRFVIAGAILFVLLRLRGEKPPDLSGWAACAAVGTLLLLLGNGGVSVAEQTVSSSIAALGVAVMPIWMALFERMFGGRTSLQEWAGLLLGLCGIALLNCGSTLRAAPVGAAALLVASLGWSFGSVWSRRLKLPSSAMASAAQMLCGGCVLLVVSAIRGEPHNVPSVGSVLAIAYLVVFGSLLAFTSYAYLLKSVRPSVATSYAYVNPVVAVILGVGLAGEHVTFIELGAMVVILLAVGLVVLKRNAS